jgi:hypothetical protein
MREWWNTPNTAWGFLVIGLGGGAVLAYVSPRIGIPIGFVLIAIGVYLLIGAYRRRAGIKQVVEELLSVGIFTDIPVNITRILYHDREKLSVGLPGYEASIQDKLVLEQLNLRKIVQLEQRKVKVFGSDNVRDEGYWILTELGKEVIRYLQANKQVLDKEGSQS